MPMIEAKVTMELPAEKRDILKAEFGKAISIMGKPESYLMINLIDKQDLYFGGKKLDKGAYSGRQKIDYNQYYEYIILDIFILFPALL